MDELCDLFDNHIPVLDKQYEQEMLYFSKNKTITDLVNCEDYLKRCYTRYKRYYKYINFQNNEIYDMMDGFFNCDQNNKELIAQKAKYIDYCVIKELEEYYY